MYVKRTTIIYHKTEVKVDIHYLTRKVGLWWVKSSSKKWTRTVATSTSFQWLLCDPTMCVMRFQVGIITTKNKRAEKLTDLSGEGHIIF